MDGRVRSYDLRLFAAYAVCSFAAVAYVPTLFPLKPTASASYAFGYNNRVGVALVFFLVALGAAWTKGLSFTFLSPVRARMPSRKVLLLALSLLLCGCAAMYALAGHFGGFGESSYEIDRVWLLAQGQKPYLDFEWPFGAALLYVPLFISRCLHITLVQSCYLFWVFSFISGAVALFFAIGMIDYPSSRKNSIFLLLFFAGFPSIVNMGTHYTFLRYSLPLLCILVVQKVNTRAERSRRIVSCLLAIVFTAILLLLSPETAIAHAFACVCIVLTARRRRAPIAGSLVILAVGFAAIFGIAAKTHILATLKASGGGADSFPIGFAPHIALFCSALFLCACYVYQRLKDGRLADNTIGLIAISIPMTAAALGRCDALHVVWNGQGIFLASLIYASNSPQAWKWLRTAYVVFAIVYPAALQADAYAGPVATILADQLHDRGDNSRLRSGLIALGEHVIAHVPGGNRRQSLMAKLQKAEQPAPSAILDLSAIYPSWHGDFLAPSAYRPAGDGFGSSMSSRVSYGYYQGFENANTQEAIERKIQELQSHPDDAVLLPENFFQSRCVVNFAAMRHGIAMNWGFPYFGRGVHPESVRLPFCEFVQSHYVLEDGPSPENFEYGLWVPRVDRAR